MELTNGGSSSCGFVFRNGTKVITKSCTGHNERSFNLVVTGLRGRRLTFWPDKAGQHFRCRHVETCHAET